MGPNKPMQGVSRLTNPVGGKPAKPAGESGFNNFAAGDKYYGQGRSAPNVGKTANKVGYGVRDGKMAARRSALLNQQKGYLK